MLEVLINVQAHLNKTIILSFHGKIEESIQHVNYGWLMFYPCLYFFAIWDAYKDDGGGQHPYSYLPFVFSAYFMTIGVIYSSELTLFQVIGGPIWLPFLFVVPGVLIGITIQKIARR
ncbi:hypothetical protein [Salibacterium salarium]|uniref:hypothetical protein n=1 Tax=Salibacterium salarium TaxID=284579 RepID=UPI003D7C9DFB